MLSLYKLQTIRMESIFKHRLREGLIKTIIFPKKYLDNVETGDIIRVKYTDEDTDIFVVSKTYKLHTEDLNVECVRRCGFEWETDLLEYLENRYSYIEDNDRLVACDVNWINSFKMNKLSWFNPRNLLL